MCPIIWDAECCRYQHTNKHCIPLSSLSICRPKVIFSWREHLFCHLYGQGSSITPLWDRLLRTVVGLVWQNRKCLENRKQLSYWTGNFTTVTVWKKKKKQTTPSKPSKLKKAIFQTSMPKFGGAWLWFWTISWTQNTKLKPVYIEHRATSFRSGRFCIWWSDIRVEERS